MKRFPTAVSRPVLGLLLVAGTGTLAACDTYEPSWFSIEHHAVLYSLSRAEFIGRESGYDFIGQVPVVVDRPKTQNPFDFDMAIVEIDGVFHAMPAGMFTGFAIRPGIVAVETGFDELETAPRDGYLTDETLPLTVGQTYAIRTRRDNRGCNMYGKFEVTDLDPAGIVEIRTLRNTLCNDRNLVPPI